MPDLVIATTPDDAKAVEAVKAHHAQMAGALAMRTEALLAATSRRDADSAARARSDLLTWCRTDLIPHAMAEESALYPAAHRSDAGRLLIDAMLREHQQITGLVTGIEQATDDTRAAAAARALQVLFDSHLEKENEQILPLLAAEPQVSVAQMLAGMHELLGGAHQHADHHHDGAHHHHDEHDHAPNGHGPAHDAGGHAHAHGADPHGEGHACACGESPVSGFPELDARTIPHAIRHATIFGALDAVRPGRGLVMVAPHDPLPLLAQLQRREPDTFDVTYLQQGPDAWRLAIVRRA